VISPERDAAGAPAEPPWRASASSFVAEGSRPLRVLLAEDDAEMRAVVAEALRGDGLDVVELSDGGRLLVEIAARLKAGRGDDTRPAMVWRPSASIDLIVSDIRMPICTGLQILAALRDAQWHTPVILMTAFGDEATRKHAESLQAVLFDKPFDIDDMRTAVANMLPSGSPCSCGP
jgi:CheY-like chemotaxis protein